MGSKLLIRIELGLAPAHLVIEKVIRLNLLRFEDDEIEAFPEEEPSCRLKKDDKEAPAKAVLACFEKDERGDEHEGYSKEDKCNPLERELFPLSLELPVVFLEMLL